MLNYAFFCAEDEEGQNVYYELNAEAEEGDTAEVLDKVPLVTSLDNKGVTAGGRNRVPLISKRRTPASANMSASMANLLEDDSVILDLERQTAMVCVIILQHLHPMGGGCVFKRPGSLYNCLVYSCVAFSEGLIE